MKIIDVILYQVRGPSAGFNFPTGDRQAMMLDIYPEWNAQDWTRERPQTISAMYVEILTDEGLSGLFGPIEDFQAFVIQRFLRPSLLGRDPLATEFLSDLMLRLNRHGRSGMFMTGVSAVDCALWDLKGKAWGQPLYRLLGGPTRPSVPAYASMLGYSVEPEQAAAIAVQYVQMGFTAQKWFFRFGPGDGETGMKRNLALVRSLRQAVGDLYPLMFDAFMAWDSRYAAQMVRLLQPYHITFLEEPLPPERVGSFQRLSALGVPLATGEHVYTRWQVKELLSAGAVETIQTDPDWTGGVSELVKICALCSAFNVPVLAHGHSLLAALHVAGAQSPEVVPMVEYLMQHQMQKQYFHTAFYQPLNGKISLPNLPGLGIVLDETKISARKEIHFA